LEIWHSRVEFAHEIKRIEHRGLRSELQGILFKAQDTLVQDDNFRHLTNRQTVGGFALVAYSNTAILGRAFHSHRHAAQLAYSAFGSCPACTLLRQLDLYCRVLPHLLGEINFLRQTAV
jgi:hypothetical protein